MSGFLFIIVVDWIMRNTNNKKRDIRWKFMSTLEDLDYADDLALISSKHSDMQEKTRRLHAVLDYTGIKINVEKTKSMKINGKEKDAIMLNDKEIEEVETFLNLGATMDKTRGTEADIGRRLGLARTAFAFLAQNKIHTSIKHHQKKKMEMDRPHPPKGRELTRYNSSHMGACGKETKRTAKEHLARLC
ncbi:uncharacterized protein LOC134281594 [Saccostrea cucullata]|uniref:uncharacterized protein LOC134281594 n=1 Tax=Saccostrea cuccullata TaxID=36930 RepID=UPI002ED4D9BE